MQHLDEGTIHAWLDSALDGDEHARVERHVATCATCAEAVAEARGMIAGASRIVSALDVVRGGVIPRQSSQRTRRRSVWHALRLSPGRAALAASLLLAAATMLSVRSVQTDRQVVSPPAADARAELPPPPPARAAATTGSPAKAAQPTRQPAPQLARQSPPQSAPQSATRDLQQNSVDEPKKPAPSAAASSGASSGAAAAMAVGAVGAMNTARRAPAFAEKAVSDAALVESNAVIGCYEITPDSAALGLFLPARFTLEQTRGTVVANIVRVVNAEDRVDSTVVGSWKPTASGQVEVRLNSPGYSMTKSIDQFRASMVTLIFTPSGTTGVASTPQGQKIINVARRSCRP